jgi:large subunit ribosomal protein L32
MGALPKRKISKGRKGRRRAHHAQSTPRLVSCPECNKLKEPHSVCPNCGQYKDKEVVAKE